MDSDNNYISLFNESVTDSLFANLLPNSILTTDKYTFLKSKQLSNGQLLIGKTGDEPYVGSLSGTTNQVNVTNGSGSITLSLPQDINISSSPTFHTLTVNKIVSEEGISISTIDANKLVCTGSLKQLQSVNITIIQTVVTLHLIRVF